MGWALGCLLWAAPASAALVDRVAAVVNNDVVVLSEVYELGGDHIEEVVQGSSEASRRSAELEVLDALVARRLIEQEMRRLSLDVTDADMERAIADICQQNGMERAQLKVEVERSGITWDAYENELRSNIREAKFNQQVLGPRISVREDEVQDYYRRHLAEIAGPARLRILAILVPIPAGADVPARQAALEKARALRTTILEGRDFAAVAREASVEPFASRGGEMGLFRKGDLMPEMDEAVFALPLGGVTEPISTTQGYFLLKVAERVAAQAPPFDDVKGQLQQKLMEEKVNDAREQWLAQARRRAAVKTLLEPSTPGN